MKLVRKIKNEYGTFGELFLNEQHFCYTCERPWDANKAMSCIPEGEYLVEKYNSPTKGAVLLLKDVPNRSMIEIHAGNTIKDTEGCILVGASYIKNGDVVTGVATSRGTLAALLTALPDETSIFITED